MSIEMLKRVTDLEYARQIISRLLAGSLLYGFSYHTFFRVYVERQQSDDDMPNDLQIELQNEFWTLPEDRWKALANLDSLSDFDSEDTLRAMELRKLPALKLLMHQ